ncbi:DUF2505 family protein [Myxococcota bacterium]|nr:DUF2505 family protein [Myxococcota bacterium]
MKFKVEHVFEGISLKDYEDLYFEEDFNMKLSSALKMERELLARDVDNGKIHRESKVAPERSVPAPVAKIIGGDKIEYVEHVDYKFGSNRGIWKTISSVITEKIKSDGNFGFEETPKGIKRWIDGEVKVKIFGVGGMVEKLIVSDIEKSYNDAAKFTQKWIDDAK